MRIVPTLSLLGGAALLLAISGCGSDGDGDGDSTATGSGSVDTLLYTGRGNELVSDPNTDTDYVGAVTSATGFFSANDYLRVKTTLRSRLNLNSSTGVLNFDLNVADGVSAIALTADAATQSYLGTYTWTESSGPMNGYTIVASISLKPSNGLIQLAMNATATGGGDDRSGTANFVYHNPYAGLHNGDGYYDGLVMSSDPRYNQACSEWGTDNGNATLTVWHDMYSWHDALSPLCYVDGSTIAGAGYFTYSSTTSESMWGSIEVRTDTYGRALDGVVVHNSLDTGKTYTFTQASLLSEQQGAAMNPSTSQHQDLTPTAVSGAILSTYYSVGTTVSNGFSRSNGLSDWHWIDFPLPAAGTGLEEFESSWGYIGAYPGYDTASRTWYGSVYDRLETANLLDDDGNQLEAKFSVTTDTTGLSTGGTLSLLHINPTSGAIVSTEQMSFTIAAAP